jgi:hypothetical protein
LKTHASAAGIQKSTYATTNQQISMKIISQDDRKIVIQCEEFIINLNGSQIVLTVILALLFIWTVLPSSGGGIFQDTYELWALAPSDRTNPLYIGVAVMGTGVLFEAIRSKLWSSIRSSAHTALSDRYTFDKAQENVEELRHKWSTPRSLGSPGDIKKIEVIVDIEYRSAVDDPENIDMCPTSLYQVIAIFEPDQQEILERNSIPLASSDQVQQLFRQTLAETTQVVAELRDFLGLSSIVDEQS